MALPGGVTTLKCVASMVNSDEKGSREAETEVKAFLNASGDVFKEKEVSIATFIHNTKEDPLDRVTVNITNKGRPTYWYNTANNTYWDRLHIHMQKDVKAIDDKAKQFVEITAETLKTGRDNLKNMGQTTYWITTLQDGRAYEWPANSTIPVGMLANSLNLRRGTKAEYDNRGFLPTPAGH